MRLFSLFILLFILLSSFETKADIPAIKGRVTDADTQAPLAGATLSIPELRISVVSDQNGEYHFPSLPSKGRFLIEVKFVGYKSVVQTINTTSLVSVDFKLK